MPMCLANWVQITNLDLNSTKPNAWLSELGLAERLKRKICKDCRTKLSSNKQAKYSSENNVLISLLKLQTQLIGLPVIKKRRGNYKSDQAVAPCTVADIPTKQHLSACEFVCVVGLHEVSLSSFLYCLHYFIIYVANEHA